MLVVVFGAGASFDSAPEVPVGGPVQGNRPPLADALFEMDRQATAEAAAAFPRAWPALMSARADVKAGGTVEQTLGRLQAESENDPRARSQLMALRFYLQRVLTRIPDAWDVQAVGQTSYVSMLDQLARWQRNSGQGLCLVTFNYDVLLERACGAVFGTHYEHMDDYQSRDWLRLYKPHGSVDWATAHVWHGGRFGDETTARQAVCDRPDLQPWQGQVEVQPSDALVIDPPDEGRDGLSVAWVPALAIPVETKPAMVMPHGHQQSLFADLGRAVAVVCVGWRAREAYFVDFLREALPSKPIPLWAVSGDRESASETIGHLWETERFDRHGTIGGGFARFADPEPPPGPGPRSGEPVLGDVLRQTAPMVQGPPMQGLPPEPFGCHLEYSHPRYGPPA